MRYGKGSNAMAAAADRARRRRARHVPGGRTWLRELWAQRRHASDLYDLRHWSERTVIALVMQTLDNSITTVGVKGRLGWRMTQQAGPRCPEPDLHPGRRTTPCAGWPTSSAAPPGGTIGEPFNRPMTAHFIGGCTIGDSPQTGVVDPWQRLYGHDGLHVVDGSAISANLGVNPSLTITAQAERAMAFWPNKGEADPRPALGSAYRRLAPVEPKNPAVPDAAPGALRLPIVGVS